MRRMIGRRMNDHDVHGNWEEDDDDVVGNEDQDADDDGSVQVFKIMF